MKKILYIDDCAEDIELAQKAFAGSEYSLDRACNTSDAYQKLQQNGHELIVCDILMPGDDGLAFAKSLVNIGAPVILMSGAMALGIFRDYTGIKNYLGFILKPVTPEKIKILLEGRNADI